MLKFLWYKVQLIIQNIGNMINYNHSLTHVMHSFKTTRHQPLRCDSHSRVTWGCNLKCDNVSTTTTITKKNNYQSTTMPETSLKKLCAYYLCEPRYQCALFFCQNEIQKASLMSPHLQDFISCMKSWTQDNYKQHSISCKHK